jgi:hypothetical protein
MTSRCKGSVHCHAVDCAKCSWRYAGRIATRIDASRNGSLYAITIDIPDASPSSFRRWRTRIRNRLDYLRTSTLWRNVGLHVWLCRDGKLRGIISIGTLGPAEVLSALSRWPMALREISHPPYPPPRSGSERRERDSLIALHGMYSVMAKPTMSAFAATALRIAATSSNRIRPLGTSS